MQNNFSSVNRSKAVDVLRNHVTEDEKSSKVTLIRHRIFTEQPEGSRAYRETQAVLFALTTEWRSNFPDWMSNNTVLLHSSHDYMIKKNKEKHHN